MALREYRGPDGREWTVWSIAPRYSPVRSGADRRRAAVAAFGVERRVATERRRRRVDPLVLHGWLCFESEGERWRLTPVPDGWDECEPERLEAYRREAEPVRAPELRAG